MSLRVRDRRQPPPDAVNTAVVAVAAIVMAVSGLIFAVLLLRGSRVTGPGIALTIGLAAGTVALRRASAARYPHVEAEEPRHIGAEDEPAGIVAPANRRRRVLTAIVSGCAVVVLGALLAPLRALTPRTVQGDAGSAWRPGTRLVTGDGDPLRLSDVPPGGVGTMWPESSVRVDDAAAVILVRLQDPPLPPTRPDWVVDRTLVAYSKVCTHMGCPVGLFQEGIGSLFCPCHQARFDASRGAEPMFGPASRPLPQLPLGTDDEGFLIALGDFTGEVGPRTGRST